jgi:hypothetical protein
MNTPFNNVTLRDWFSACSSSDDFNITSVTTLGSGPFAEFEYDEFLKRHKIECYNLSEEIEVLIVGRESWFGWQIIEMLKLRKGKTLKVYSQEMFLSFLFTGRDPFAGPPEVLDEFARIHPVYTFLNSLKFRWPSTLVTTSCHQKLKEVNWPERGALAALGYRVGRSGLTEARRRLILSNAFNNTLLSDLPRAYLNEWGSPQTAQRLKKIADSLAAFCRNAKNRQSQNMEQTIDNYEDDLYWLKENYYDKLGFTFYWPDTIVP